MLGLFDSGRGGLNTVEYLKESGDAGSLVYLIDGGNAPYGTKTVSEIVKITEQNVKLLTDMGARRVLIACCTASTVHPYLNDEYRKKSIPIIEPVANAAKCATKRGRIGVIATEHTVHSGAFPRALRGFEVEELPLSELVPLIDGGLSDATANEGDVRMLKEMLRPILTKNIDVLILGCTHFPALKRTIEKIANEYGDVRLIDSARVGADVLRKYKNGK